MDARQREALRLQLVATQTSIDAALAALDLYEPGECSHPAERIIPPEEFGDLFRCGVCGAESETPDFSELVTHETKES